MKYRKKPVAIEAIQWTGSNLEEIKAFVGQDLIYDIYDAAWKAEQAPPYISIKIKTLEGVMSASVGDYIIKGVDGEFYPCKPDIFEKMYDIVNEEDEPKPITNYERIKQMTLEEIAYLLDDFHKCNGCKRIGNDCFPAPSIEFIENWLKKEVDNNGKDI